MRTLVEPLCKPHDVNKRFSKPCLVNLISKDTHLVFSLYLQLTLYHDYLISWIKFFSREDGVMVNKIKDSIEKFFIEEVSDGDNSVAFISQVSTVQYGTGPFITHLIIMQLGYYTVMLLLLDLFTMEFYKGIIGW